MHADEGEPLVEARVELHVQESLDRQLHQLRGLLEQLHSVQEARESRGQRLLRPPQHRAVQHRARP